MKKITSKTLNVFPNPNPERDYEIHMECPEFTCLCPKTGQPDFAKIEIWYIPNKLCIELKSLKLYLWSYRNERVFHEGVINKILDDLCQECLPRYMKIIGKFNVRGGIYTSVMAEHKGGKKSETKRKNKLPKGKNNSN